MLSQAGEILIEYHYRGLIRRNVVDHFMNEYNKCSNPLDLSPVIATSKHSLIHVQKNNLIILAVGVDETPPLLVIEWMYRLIDVIYDYFEATISGELVKEQFVTIYQILDEMMDNGHPFSTVKKREEEEKKKKKKKKKHNKLFHIFYE